MHSCKTDYPISFFFHRKLKQISIVHLPKTYKNETFHLENVKLSWLPRHRRICLTYCTPGNEPAVDGERRSKYVNYQFRG